MKPHISELLAALEVAASSIAGSIRETPSAQPFPTPTSPVYNSSTLAVHWVPAISCATKQPSAVNSSNLLKTKFDNLVNHRIKWQHKHPSRSSNMLNQSLKAALLAALILISAAQAQTSFGRISGTVTDATGAVVPNAKVTVRNTDTQDTRLAETDLNGFYVITNLAIGPYNVDVAQTGFQRQQQTGIAVVADGRATADFKLQIGDVAVTMDVSAKVGEALNTVSGDLSRVIDSKQIDELSLNGNNYVDLITLVPGAVVTNPDQFSVTTSLSATNQTINGNRSDSQNLTVDGAFNLVAGSNGSLMNNVNPNFISEVKVQTSNMSAEWGRAVIDGIAQARSPVAAVVQL